MTDDNRLKTVPSHYDRISWLPCYDSEGRLIDMVNPIHMPDSDRQEPTPEALDESMWSNKHSIAEELKAIHKELKDIKALIKAGKEE